MKINRNVLFAFVPWQVFLLSQSPSSALDALGEVKIAGIRITTDRLCSPGGTGVGNHDYKSRIALTPEAQRKGLSLRTEPLKQADAMIFPFFPPASAVFWMKETYIPLAIAFFDDTGTLISKFAMSVEPDPSNPKETYQERKGVSIAVETSPDALPSWNPGETFLCIDYNDPNAVHNRNVGAK